MKANSVFNFIQAQSARTGKVDGASSAKLVFRYFEGPLDLLHDLLRIHSVTLLCDNNVFSRYNQSTVPVVLRHPGLRLITEVKRELRDFLNASPRDNEENAIMRMVANTPIAPFDPAAFAAVAPAAEYYLNVLQFRTTLLDVFFREFEAKHSREPTDKEKDQIRRELRLSSRTNSLASTRARQQPAVRWLLTDERLVVYAFALSALSRSTVLILSSDNDVVEQAYKLFSILRNDLASHLIANELAGASRRVPLETYWKRDRVDLFFDGEESYAIPYAGNVDDRLPSTPIETWVVVVRPLGDGFQCFEFPIASQLRNLFEARTVARRNTNQFGEHNAYCDPFCPSSVRPGALAVVRDRVSNILPVWRYDADRSIRDFERPRWLTDAGTEERAPAEHND